MNQLKSDVVPSKFCTISFVCGSCSVAATLDFSNGGSNLMRMWSSRKGLLYIGTMCSHCNTANLLLVFQKPQEEISSAN